MAEKDRQLKNGLSALLGSKGFKVIPIATSDGPTPDLAASGGQMTYLIEIKHKLQRAPQADEAETGVRWDRVGRSNRLSGIVKKATDQLQSRQTDETVNLMWFFGECPDQHLQYYQLRATVYGMRLVVATEGEVGVVKYGYYVTHSDFYRWRDVLDGVALGNLEGFLLNDLSSRYLLTKKSRLARLFGEAVHDPIAQEASSHIYRVDGDIDPNDGNAAKQFLEERYGITVAHFTELSRISAEL